jgi:hypothetical protein
VVEKTYAGKQLLRIFSQNQSYPFKNFICFVITLVQAALLFKDNVYSWQAIKEYQYHLQIKNHLLVLAVVMKDVHIRKKLPHQHAR